MPWNKPGSSSNNKDPWTGRPKQTPPDLEALLRDLLKKVAALFRLKFSAIQTTSLIKALLPPSLNAKAVGSILSLLVLVYLFSGLFVIEPSERAIVTRFGQYITSLAPGRHWILRPIESYYLIRPEQNPPLSYRADLLARGGNPVVISTTLYYRIVNAHQYLFANTRALQSLQAFAAQALQKTVEQQTLEQLLSPDLSSLEETVQAQVNESLTRYHTGLALSRIELQPIQVPEALRASFADLSNARAEKEQLKNQARTYARQMEPIVSAQSEHLIDDARLYEQTVIAEAKAETARFLALLPAYEASPLLTRKRLYLEAVQIVMAHSNKVLLAPSSNPLPLPLHLSFDQDGTSLVPETTLPKSDAPADRQSLETAGHSTSSGRAKSTSTNRSMPSSYDISGGYNALG